MDNRKQLCVIFDIDETLIQFVSKKYKSVWNKLDETVKEAFNVVNHKEHMIILRPHIKELFDYFKATPQIKVGLWTYSEREYSVGIAKFLSEVLDLPDNFFLFTWGAEDMEINESYTMPKDLNIVYHTFHDFNKFNTFIVDDLYKNIKHDSNINNSVILTAFAPLGTSKVRVDIGAEQQMKLSNDTAFLQLKEICEKSLNDIVNCDSEDIDESFTVEAIFNEKRLKRMGLISFMKKYAVQFVNMMSIGVPMQTNEFILITQDYGMHVKGGKTKRYRHRRKSTKRKYY